MDFSSYFTYALIAVAVFTVYMAFVRLFSKDRVQQRAKEIAEALPEQDDRGLGAAATIMKQFLILTGVNLARQRTSILQLSKAGYNSQRALVYLLFFKRFVQPFFLFIGGYILFHIFTFFREPSEHGALIITGFLLVITGAYGATLFLTNQSQKRTKELIRTFPDALDMILICVESGLGIDAAFARVCKEMKESHPVVAAEFDRTRFEMTMMSDRVQALQNFGDRAPTGAVRTLVSSLIQAERFGTSLVDTMRMIAEEQRTDRMMKAEERAARLPALITLPLILFILPGLFMIILGPAIIRLNQQGGLFGDADK
ncbi:MAG: type II secretion system F family protein [Rickettsiales bacterium]